MGRTDFPSAGPRRSQAALITVLEVDRATAISRCDREIVTPDGPTATSATSAAKPAPSVGDHRRRRLPDDRRVR